MGDERRLNKLIERIRQDDKNAIEDLYREYHTVIFAEAYAITKKKEIAEDVTEDVFLKIITYRGEQIRQPKAWLRKLVCNSCYTYFRQRKEISLDEAYSEASENYFYGNFYGADGRLRLLEMIGVLNGEERKIVIDHVFWGFHLKEIASERGMSYVTVKRKYKRIKEKLSEYLNS